MKITISEEGKEAAKRLIPEHMIGSLLGFFEKGWAPGDFLRGILENDLIAAVLHADEVNKKSLPDYAAWLYNYAPGRPLRWGSHAAVQQHLKECFEENEAA